MKGDQSKVSRYQLVTGPCPPPQLHGTTEGTEAQFPRFIRSEARTRSWGSGSFLLNPHTSPPSTGPAEAEPGPGSGSAVGTRGPEGDTELLPASVSSLPQPGHLASRDHDLSHSSVDSLSIAQGLALSRCSGRAC